MDQNHGFVYVVWLLLTGGNAAATTASLSRGSDSWNVHATKYVCTHIAKSLVGLLAALKNSVLIGGRWKTSELVLAALQELLFLIAFIITIDICLRLSNGLIPWLRMSPCLQLLFCFWVVDSLSWAFLGCFLQFSLQHFTFGFWLKRWRNVQKLIGLLS